MKHAFTVAAFAAATMALAGQAAAVTLTFEDLAEGTTLSNQYAAAGAVFSPNAFSGAGSSSSGKDWATNSDMTIVASAGAGADVGGLGTPSLVSGNVLHAFSNWSNEDGDASFRISFSTPVTFFSATFAGVSALADTRVFFFNGTAQLTVVSGAGKSQGQFVLSGAFPSITSVVVTPGSSIDWVGVDNIVFTPSVVPEPTTYAAMALGLGLLAFALRRR